jgi:hypothetical protein
VDGMRYGALHAHAISAPLQRQALCSCVVVMRLLHGVRRFGAAVTVSTVLAAEVACLAQLALATLGQVWLVLPHSGLCCAGCTFILGFACWSVLFVSCGV